MGVKIDFASVKDGFEPIEEGIYEVRLAAFEVKDAGDKPYVNLEFDLTDPEYDGRKVWKICSLKPTALWVLKGAMIVLGADEDDVNAVNDSDLLPPILTSLVGNTCAVAVTIDDTYDGTPRNKVEKILAADAVKLPF